MFTCGVDHICENLTLILIYEKSGICFLNQKHFKDILKIVSTNFHDLILNFMIYRTFIIQNNIS